MNDNGHVPILGNKPRVALDSVMCLIRNLDPDGTFEPQDVTQTPAGMVAHVGRANTVTAEDLVEMIREAVREEVREALIPLIGDTRQDRRT